jgi:hypothetical protein
VTSSPLPEYVYHTTFLRNVEGIGEEGLVPSGDSQFGGGYSGHSKGRVFFSDFDGVYFWMSKFEAIANGESDFRSDDERENTFGYSPVVLRVADLALPEEREMDALGFRDSGWIGAWYVTKVVPAAVLEIYDGRAWVPLEEVDIERMYDRAEAAAELEMDDSDEDSEEGWDEDGGGYWTINFDLFQPSEP